ncbi:MULTISPECIES: peptidoglycan-binding protein [unclassified Streptomyces]|uniref:peptidoglycan-binding domain-containing protein n=1 Tax=unclassified Streptomyces TaxID=2593676 RepID=UPI003800C9C1
MSGQLCPGCGTPPGAEGRPGCDCGGPAQTTEQPEQNTQATQATPATPATEEPATEENAGTARSAQDAEIAESEDFHPLRVRPYVNLGDQDVAAVPTAFRTAGPLPPLTPAAVTEPAVASAEPPPARFPPTPPPAGRRTALRLVAAGAVAVAVIGTAAFAGGLFAGADREDHAVPDTISTWLPSANDGTTEEASAPTTPSPTASAPPPAVTESPSAEITPSAPPSAGSPGPSVSEKPTATATPSASAETSAAAEPGKATGGTLAPGDSGDEVVELQFRLARVGLFYAQPNGQYDRSVEDAVRRFQQTRNIQDDTAGVYGPRTRLALETETQGSGQNGQGYGQSYGQGYGSRG